MTCVSVYPFYRKLGFRPGRPDLLRIVLREERKIATMPGYRTPVRTLRKLATGHLFLELPGTTQEIWDRFRIQNIGFAVQRRIAKDHAGDAAVARNRAATAVADALGERLEAWTGEARRTFEDFALVLAPSSPDLARWTPGEKRPPSGSFAPRLARRSPTCSGPCSGTRSFGARS